MHYEFAKYTSSTRYQYTSKGGQGTKYTSGVSEAKVLEGEVGSKVQGFKFGARYKCRQLGIKGSKWRLWSEGNPLDAKGILILAEDLLSPEGSLSLQ